MAALRGYQAGMEGREGLILCAREFMNSLDDSSLEEIKAAIASVSWLAAYYEVGEKFIRSRDGRVRFAFAGLRHNLGSIKSKARIILAWVDEAEAVGEAAWQKLIPTIREEGAEIWVTWNPEDDRSSTHKRFRLNPPDDSKIVEINWQDNPWFPAGLNKKRLEDAAKRPDDYDHVWEGGFRSASQARIFRNYRVADLGEPEGVIWFYGVDWGFSVDPLAGNRFCFPDEYTLYITHEVSEVGCSMEKQPQALIAGLPGIAQWPASADSARPDIIDYARRHGIPKLRPAIKGAGSVEDGITFLQGFDIVLHPRCSATLNEFNRYSYKRDPKTEEILPIVEDDWNHNIDSIRYGAERAHRKGKLVPGVVKTTRKPDDYGANMNDDEGETWRTA